MSSVTLEDYAQMRAEMDFGIRRDDVLSRAGIGADEWIEVQREWLEKMGAELDTGRFELTGRYSGAFLERQRTLTPKMPLAEPPLTDTADEASPLGVAVLPFTKSGSSAPPPPDLAAPVQQRRATPFEPALPPTPVATPERPPPAVPASPMPTPPAAATPPPAPAMPAPARPPEALVGRSGTIGPEPPAKCVTPVPDTGDPVATRSHVLPFDGTAESPPPQCDAPSPHPKKGATLAFVAFTPSSASTPFDASPSEPNAATPSRQPVEPEPQANSPAANAHKAIAFKAIPTEPAAPSQNDEDSFAPNATEDLGSSPPDE